MRAFTVHTDDGRIVVEPGIRLEGGRLTLPAMEPTADLLGQYGSDGLIDRTTPYRRLDPTSTTIDPRTFRPNEERVARYCGYRLIGVAIWPSIQ